MADAGEAGGGEVTIVIALLAAAQVASPQASLDAMVAPLAKAEAPGCAVAAARGGERIATAAFGAADMEHGAAITPDSIFEAGSVAKQFTAAAVVLLAADGKLAFGANIRTYLPELPDYGMPITIDQLLSHTSGLRDWGAIAAIGGWERGTRAYTNGDALRIVARQRALNYPPGTEYSYTNSGYNLLAIIVERVSGQSLAAFTKARLFDPLGMAQTSWRDDFRRIVKGRAIAYMPTAGGGWEEGRPFENDYGNGGLLTTVGDLLIWNEALSTGRLGPQIAMRMAERATLAGGRVIPYARGLQVTRYRGRESVAHSGATGGYRAWLERFPAERLSVAVLCNGGSLDPVGLGRRFADTLLPAPVAAVQPDVAVAAERAREGLYVNQSIGRPTRLAFDGTRLKLDGVPALSPVAAGAYRAGEIEVRFTGMDGFTVTTPDTVARFVRSEPYAPDAAALAAFAGDYASDEAEARYTVAVAGSGIRLTNADRPWMTQQLAPSYRDAFVDESTVVRFTRDAAGKVTGLRIGIGRVRDLAFRRVAAR